MQRFMAMIAVGAALAFAAPNAAEAQQQSGLVNVNVGDVTVLENVAIGVAAQVVANVCPNVQVGQVAVLARQVIRSGQESETICEGTVEGATGPITIAPREGGATPPNGTEGPQQSGLVNVNVGDVTVLENVAVGVAAQAVANVCPNVQVGQVAVLATQAIRTGQQSETICEGTAEGETGPITIEPVGGGESRR